MMAILIAGEAVYVLFLAVMYRLAGKQFQDYIDLNRSNLIFPFLSPVALYIDQRLKKVKAVTGLQIHTAKYMSMLHDEAVGSHRAVLFIVNQISKTIMLVLLFSLLAIAVNGDSSILAAGILLAAFENVLQYKHLERKVRNRKRKIIWELPEIMNKMTLLVNAGETVRQAFIRCADASPQDEPSPLQAELLQAVNRLQNQEPFADVLEQFVRRCGVPEVSMFVTVLLLNYRRGGEELVFTLRELSAAMWEKRKAMARTLGEEASSKLVFPMVLIFLVIMIIVAAPAVMMMNE